MPLLFRHGALLLLCFLISACRPYYQRQSRFLEQVRLENYDRAELALQKNRKARRERYKLLYLLNRAYTDYQQGKWAESSAWFMKADLLDEAYRKQWAYEALAILINPNVKPYRLEDAERVMLHYYHGMDFLQQRNLESALVECRRMNLSLQNMQYSGSDKPKYKDDAFGHLLMGLCYEAAGDVNNAFIAYRNAAEVYRADYATLFDTPVPDRLKRDVIRTARQSGFPDEARHWASEFGLSDTIDAQRTMDAELVLFWENGLGPVKEAWSIDFTYSKVGDQVVFVNTNLGLQFVFPASGLSASDQSNLAALKVFRIAFPRYKIRPERYAAGRWISGTTSGGFESAQPIDRIAIQSLQDRFGREMGAALLRFAVKKATEYALRQENKEAGAVLGLANAFTEQADTRNWQTLPAHISYARIPLQKGLNHVVFKARSYTGRERTDTIKVDAISGRMYFRSISTLKP